MPFPYTFGDVPTAEDYARQLAQLLPRGSVWQLEADSELRRLLLGISDELDRVRARGANLIEETDPSTASETIADWERVLSLPDERVTTIPGTLEERRVAVTQKYIAREGQNNAFFVGLALACGYVVTVSTYNATLARVGRLRCPDPLCGLAYAYSMKVTVSPPVGVALSHDNFERVIRHVTHAHIIVVFVFL